MRNKIIYLSLFISNINYILYNALGINDTLKNGIRVSVIGLLIFSILLSRKTVTFIKEDFIWVFLLVFTIIGLSFNMNLINYLYIILFLIISRHIDTEKLFSWNFRIMLMSLAFITILLLTGLTTNVQYVFDGRLRNTFGFSNVNAFSNVIYSFSVLFLLSRKSLSLGNITLVLALILTTYRYTDTRTATYAFFMYIAVAIFCSFLWNSNSKFILRMGKNAIYSIILLPLIFSLGSPWLFYRFPWLDTILSNRLRIFTNYIESNTFKNILFGGTKVPDIDNGYLVTLYGLGILFSIFILYIILKAVSNMMYKQNTNTIALVVSFVFFNAFESIMIRPELSVSIIFWVIIYRYFIINATVKKSLTG